MAFSVRIEPKLVFSVFLTRVYDLNCKNVQQSVQRWNKDDKIVQSQSTIKIISNNIALKK